jgi:hypothetical protein
VAEREGTVFIAEDPGGEPHWFAATFSAHWEAPHGRGFREGPRGVSAEEAIAWGREQADRVLLRLADSEYYSAGERPAADREPLPEDLAVEPRREPGMEYLDLVCEEPIAWEVRLPRWVSRERTDADVARLQAALEADPGASRVRVKVKRGERVEAILRFVVQAHSHAEALKAVTALERRAVDTVPYPVDELPDSGGGGFVVHSLNPWKDIRPAEG